MKISTIFIITSVIALSAGLVNLIYGNKDYQHHYDFAILTSLMAATLTRKNDQ